MTGKKSMPTMKRSKIVNGWILGEKLCEVLGLDASLVCGLTIDIRSNEIGAMMANVTVEMFPTEAVLNLDWGELLADIGDREVRDFGDLR